MCGLFGFKLKTSLDDSTIYEAKKKLEDLKHRGPDNIGFWFDKKEGIFLGHTRLSIIDLTKDSNQPISKKNHHMIYNGEIYNHKILKKSLETKGVNFQTKGEYNPPHMHAGDISFVIYCAIPDNMYNEKTYGRTIPPGYIDFIFGSKSSSPSFDATEFGSDHFKKLLQPITHHAN